MNNLSSLYQGCHRSEKNSLSSGKVREIYLESEKIDILKKVREKWNNLTGMIEIPLRAGRNIWGYCDLNNIFH